MKILYLGAPVPETDEFRVPGFYRAGNLALRGISEGLYAEDPSVSVWGFQSVQSFPRFSKLFVGYRRIVFPSGMVVRLLPYVNVLFVRELIQAIWCFLITVGWGVRNLFKPKCTIVYNLYRPPLPVQWLACRLVGSKLVPIIFDVGMPPGSLGKLRDWIYQVSEAILKIALKHIDGAAVIVENIINRYCRGIPWLLVDGGVSPDIQSRLFDLNRDGPDDGITRFVFAGSLARHNGLYWLLDALRKNTNPNLQLTIAGAAEGDVAEAIATHVKNDSRVRYVGMLDLDQLFSLYRQCDCVMNLRMTKGLDTSTWFPSKFLEAMVVGRSVLSTNVSHLKEVYGKYCYVLEDENADALSDMLDCICLAGRKARDLMGAGARNMMLKEHTWEIQMKRLVQFCGALFNR